jgi:hypothetical protein
MDLRRMPVRCCGGIVPHDPRKDAPLTTNSRLPRLPASLVLLLAVALGLWVRDIAKAIGTPIPALPMPFGGSLLDNLLATALALLTAIVLLAPGRSLARSLGLQWNGARGPLLVLLATVPCWLGLWWLGALATDIDPLSLLMLALLFPLAEEILYRGLGFVFAQRVLGWPWWLAASVQAVLFGAVHWLGFGVHRAGRHRHGLAGHRPAPWRGRVGRAGAVGAAAAPCTPRHGAVTGTYRFLHAGLTHRPRILARRWGLEPPLPLFQSCHGARASCCCQSRMCSRECC